MERYLGENTHKLGFGLMRLPKLPGGEIDIGQTAEMVDCFMAAGFTYFDTAYAYDGGGSERAAKAALVDRYPRDNFTLATKVCAWAEASPAEQLAESLERTGAGYIDYYLIHAVQKGNIQKYEDRGIWDFMAEQKARGLVRHWGFSYHDTPEFLDELLTKHPEAEFVQLQINYADWDDPRVAARRCYETVRAHGKSVVIMEPVKGGTLAQPPQAAQDIFRAADGEASFASWAIRYAASLDGVMAVLSGMSTLAQTEDNVSYMKQFRPLDGAERAVIAEAQKAIQVNAIPCTACRYCTAGCPQSIPIPDIFAARNRELVWGRTEEAAAAYEKLAGAGHTAGDCVACGQCESVCPQHIDIIRQLSGCAAAFGK